MRKLLFIAIILALSALNVEAATVTNNQCSSEITWHTGGGTLANNAQVQTATVNQLTCAGYRHAYCTFNMPAPAATTVAGALINVWARVTTDTAGTVFPDGSATVTPADAPLMTFYLTVGTGAQIATAYVQNLPLGTFRAVIRNESGATINNSPAWTLKCRPHTESVN